MSEGSRVHSFMVQDLFTALRVSLKMSLSFFSRLEQKSNDAPLMCAMKRSACARVLLLTLSWFCVVAKVGQFVGIMRIAILSRGGSFTQASVSLEA